jgi:hypothetical protein
MGYETIWILGPTVEGPTSNSSMKKEIVVGGSSRVVMACKGNYRGPNSWKLDCNPPKDS